MFNVNFKWPVLMHTVSCVLVSYHPETKFGNFFLVQRNNIIIDILIDVCNDILDKIVIDTWVYNETNEYRKLAK